MPAETLRRRKAKENTATTNDTGDLAMPPLKRSASWHTKAADHVLSRRRYSLLAGVLLGVAGFALLNLLYFEHQNPGSMSQLPSESIRVLRAKFRDVLDVNDDFLSSFEFRPLLSSSPDRPGLQLAAQNVTAYSPVVLLPGFTSTGLEIWEGSECSKAYFRQRMWGTTRMLQQFMLNQKCWLEHVMLNRSTGLDPQGIKLRPASGLEAADYIVGGFWVWGKIIENLADIGYDSNNLFMAPYDWRLTPSLMQVRDRYFTRLKYMIEMARAANGDRKVVVVAHSYATQVMVYFMKWVESPHGGHAGPHWVDANIEAFVNIAGPTLGTVKSISALMSGEMKDTAELGGLSRFLEFFFAHPSRAALARSWSSVFTMLPIGGEAIWGDANGAPDEVASRFAKPTEGEDGEQVVVDAATIPAHVDEHGSSGLTVQFTNDSHSNLTITQVHNLLGAMDANLHTFREMIDVNGVADDPAAPEYDDPRYWINPLTSTLPRAPTMKMFCMYGVGKPVERGYVYQANDPDDDVPMDDGRPTVPFVLQTDFDDLPWIKDGIRYTDGDGTVPLISLGYMCARGWRTPKYNPGGMEIRVREYVHKPVSIIFDPRGGPATSDHVDIMGNHEMITDILRVCGRVYDQVPERISSQILEIAAKVAIEL